jgi:hypothetical protein
MSHVEFLIYAAGRAEASKDDLRRLAVHAYWLMSAWVKDPPSPAELVGDVVTIPAGFFPSVEALKDHLEAITSKKGGAA